MPIPQTLCPLMVLRNLTPPPVGRLGQFDRRLRFNVLTRDSFSCCSCGASPAIQRGVQLEVDHILPWSKGRRNYNRQPADALLRVQSRQERRALKMEPWAQQQERRTCLLCK